MRNPLARILIILATVAMGGAITRWPRDLGQEAPIVGDIGLVLQRVTLGKEHEYGEGNAAGRILHRVFARDSEEAFGFVQHRHTASEDHSLVFWFQIAAPAQYQDAPRRWLDDSRGDTIRIRDDHGCELSVPATVLPLASQRSRIIGVETPVFPRHTAELELFVGDRSASRPLARFRIDNPDPGPHPVWIPEELPITARAGDLSVILREFTTHASAQGMRRAAPVGTLRWTYARFEVCQSGELSDAWAPVAVELADATGNRFAGDTEPIDRSVLHSLIRARPRVALGRSPLAWPTAPADVQLGPGERVLPIRGDLCRQEPAYRLRVALLRLPDDEARPLSDVRTRIATGRLVASSPHEIPAAQIDASGPIRIHPGEPSGSGVMRLRVEWPTERHGRPAWWWVTQAGSPTGEQISQRTPTGTRLIYYSEPVNVRSRGSTTGGMAELFLSSQRGEAPLRDVFLTFQSTEVRWVEFLAQPQLPGTLAP